MKETSSEAKATKDSIIKRQEEERGNGGTNADVVVIYLLMLMAYKLTFCTFIIIESLQFRNIDYQHQHHAFASIPCQTVKKCQNPFG